MHSNRYTLLFTAIITIVLASLLSLADSSLKEKFERNVDVDIKKNILGSLGFEASDDSPWTNEDVESIFQNSIVGFVVDNSGFVVEDKLPEDIDPSIDLDLFPLATHFFFYLIIKMLLIGNHYLIHDFSVFIIDEKRKKS